MPEKQKPRDRKELFTTFVAFSMTILLLLWNAFAHHDRGRIEPVLAAGPALQGQLPNACTTSTPMENTGTRCITVTRTRSS